MPYLKEFTLSNFKIFEKPTSFELAPVTLLTGRNSSGKSSLIKALLLVDENIRKNSLSKLDCSGERMQLGTFKDIKNWNCQNGKVSFGFTFSMDGYDKYGTAREVKKYIFGDTIEMNYSFIDSDGDSGLLDRHFVFDDGIGSGLLSEDNNNNVKRQFVITIIKYIQKYKEITEPYNSSLVKIKKRKFKEGEREKSKWATIELMKMLVSQLVFGAYEDEIMFLADKELQLFDFQEITKRLTDHYKPKTIERVCKRIFEYCVNRFTVLNFNKDLWYIPETASGCLRSYSKILEGRCQESPHGAYFINLDHENNQIGKHIQLSVKQKKLIGNITIAELIDPNFLYFFSNILKKNLEFAFNISNRLDIVHLPTTRGSLQRLYKYTEQGELNQTLKKIRSSPLHQSQIDFINKWLKEFELADEVKIESAEGVAAKIFLIQNEKKLLLADHGFGVTQLISILLRIVTYHLHKDPYEPPTPGLFIVEEPESNLHPALQSKIADLIVEATKKYSVQFILETHSEYLIRRLQYLVAKEEIKPEKIALYYFNGNVPDKDLVDRIEFDSLGNLKTAFGEGFFDERTTLQDELDTQQKIKELEGQIADISIDKTCLIFTEDKDIKLCEIIFYEIAGFKPDETEIISFDGKQNITAAIMSTEILKKNKVGLRNIIFHRDLDGYRDENMLLEKEERFARAARKLKKLNDENESIRYEIFLTDYYDLEAYFINAEHVNELYPEIRIEEANGLIEEATKNRQKISLKKAKSKFDRDASEEEIEEYYFENVEKFRYGKEVLKELERILKYRFKENEGLVRKSGVICIPQLEKLKDQIWEEK